MNTPNLSKAVRDGTSGTIQLLEIAANELPRGDLRDLLLGTAEIISKMKIELAAALAVQNETRIVESAK